MLGRKQNKAPLHRQGQTEVSVSIWADLSILTVSGRLKGEQWTGLPQLSPLLCLAWENAEAIKRVAGAWRVEVWRRPQALHHLKCAGNGCGELWLASHGALALLALVRDTRSVPVTSTFARPEIDDFLWERWRFCKAKSFTLLQTTMKS